MSAPKNDFKKVNYFKRSGTSSAVGVALLGLAAVLLIWGWSYVSYLIMVGSVLAGLICLLLGTLTRASEKDMDSELEHLLRELDVNPERDLKEGSRLLTGLSPEVCEGYEYRQGVMLRRDKSSKLRTSQYTRAVFYPLEQKLLVRYCMVSLISSQRAEKTLEIPYGELASVELKQEERRLTFGKQGFTAHAVILELRWGTQRLSVPAQRSLRTEEFVEKLQKQIAKSE
jgi:hypothetical protein